MPADKKPQRTEPSFGPSADPGADTGGGGAPHAAKPKRTLSSEFKVIPADRAGGAPIDPAALRAAFRTERAEPSLHSHRASAGAGDERSRAPLSTDPEAQRAAQRAQTATTRGGMLGTAVTLASIAVLAGVLAVRFPEYLPASVTSLWRSPAPPIREVASTASTPSVTPFSPPPQTPLLGTTPTGPASASPPKIDPMAQEIGTARLATPPVSNTKNAPAIASSPEKETNLALATQGMKAVEPPPQQALPQVQPPANQSPKSQTQPAPVAPKATATATPKAASAPVPAQPVAQPKQQTQPQAQTKAPQEDFLAMVNGALKNGTPVGASTNNADEASAAGELVQSVQLKLRDRGYDPGSVDGRAGTKTTEAIRSFQRSVGMNPDGQIDMALMEKLGVVGKRLQFPTR